MDPLKIKIGNANFDIPAWLIVWTVIIGVSIFLMIFNDLTFMEIYNFFSKAWKENVKG